MVVRLIGDGGCSNGLLSCIGWWVWNWQENILSDTWLAFEMANDPVVDEWIGIAEVVNLKITAHFRIYLLISQRNGQEGILNLQLTTLIEPPRDNFYALQKTKQWKFGSSGKAHFQIEKLLASSFFTAKIDKLTKIKLRSLWQQFIFFPSYSCFCHSTLLQWDNLFWKWPFLSLEIELNMQLSKYIDDNATR